MKQQNIKIGYKKTKLGLIPNEWKTPRINETFEFLRNTSFSRSQLNYNNDSIFFYIHYGDIHSTFNDPILSFKNTDNIPRLNDDIQLNQNTSFLKNGDLIIADASEDYEGIGEAIEITDLNNKKVISGLHTFALRDNSNLTTDGFRTYIFKNFLVKKALKTIATGSKVYGISKGNLQKFKIVLPPLNQQKKIAKILSTWDVAINKQTQLIQAKQKQKKALMQLLLTGKKRFAGFTEEWKEVRLGEIFNIKRGGSPRPIKKYITEDEGYNWIKIGDTKSVKKYIYTTKEKIKKEGLKKSLLVKNGDFILSNSMSFGRPYIMRTEGCIHDGWLLLRLKNKLSTDFMYYYLSSEIIYNKFQNRAAGSAVRNLNIKLVNSIKSIIPNYSEQQRIAQVLSKADQEIELLEKQLSQLKQQKQGLMQVLLTGKVLVKV